MKKDKILKIIALALNLTIVVATTYIMIKCMTFGFTFGTQNFNGGIEFLKYFTNLSSLYAALVALYLFIYNIIHFNDDKPLPRWLSLVALGASTAVALTFVTVVFFLAPTTAINTGNYWLMFSNEMIFTHALTPIMSCVVFIFLTKHEHLTYKDAFFGVIPMGLYAIFYITFYFTKVWPDFYGFTFGGKNWVIPIVLPIMISVTYLASWLLTLATHRRQK
ncbi:MAG: hypothetical protein K5906_00260 [Bacilli bacterium]|nr:hypothetical protein [Bacilli bacterium]